MCRNRQTNGAADYGFGGEQQGAIAVIFVPGVVVIIFVGSSTFDEFGEALFVGQLKDVVNKGIAAPLERYFVGSIGWDIMGAPDSDYHFDITIAKEAAVRWKLRARQRGSKVAAADKGQYTTSNATKPLREIVCV